MQKLLKDMFSMRTFRSCKIRVYPQTSVSTLLQVRDDEEEKSDDPNNESFSFFSLYFSDINEAFFYVLLKHIPLMHDNNDNTNIYKIDICHDPHALIHTSPYPSLFPTFSSTIVFLQHTKYAQQLKKYMHRALFQYRMSSLNNCVLFNCSLHVITFHVQAFNDSHL